jgi:hypothetical protein
LTEMPLASVKNSVIVFTANWYFCKCYSRCELKPTQNSD